MPVRDGRRAAQSRVKRQLEAHWKGKTPGYPPRTTGMVPGGMTFALSVADQERVLAVGQAELIEWALRNDLPLFLLHFPRLVEDREYLIETLWPWLGGFCDRTHAAEVFDAVAEPRGWDVDEDLTDSELDASETVAFLTAENEALRAVLERTKASLAATSEELAESRLEGREAARELAHHRLDGLRLRTETVEHPVARAVHLHHQRAQFLGDRHRIERVPPLGSTVVKQLRSPHLGDELLVAGVHREHLAVTNAAHVGQETLWSIHRPTITT